jgi:Protein of Unknown function (DUF2784)
MTLRFGANDLHHLNPAPAGFFMSGYGFPKSRPQVRPSSRIDYRAGLCDRPTVLGDRHVQAGAQGRPLYHLRYRNSTMSYAVLADLVVIVHVLFVSFVVFGGLLVLRFQWVVWIHLPALCWGILIELLGVGCPLTPLENRLRHQAGEVGYPGGFLEHYLVPILYPDGLTRRLQIALGVALIIINAIVYWRVIARWRRDRGA